MALIPPQPVGQLPGSSYWNDWIEKIRTIVNELLTSITWTTISGTPTTLAGYGITNAQPLDADLTAIAAQTGTGLLIRTGTDTWTTRSVTGTANRITITNGDGVAGAPTIDIASTYVGQASITTVGTITTGTWNGTIVGAAFGGTGANLTGGGNADRLVVTNVAGTALTTTNLVDGGTF